MKQIPVDTRYFINILGQVFSKRTGKLKTVKYQRDISGKYKRVCLGKKHYLVHRLVALTYFPIDSPETLEVNHIDGDMLNNYLVNLEWVTKGENQKHAYDTGLKRLPKGEFNANHKLSDQSVIEIYQNLLAGVSIKELALEYKVSNTTIGRVKKKDAWIHITRGFEDIPTRYRTKPLNSDQVEIIEDRIRSGLDFKNTRAAISFPVSQDQFYRIKSLL